MPRCEQAAILKSPISGRDRLRRYSGSQGNRSYRRHFLPLAQSATGDSILDKPFQLRSNRDRQVAIECSHKKIRERTSLRCRLFKSAASQPYTFFECQLTSPQFGNSVLPRRTQQRNVGFAKRRGEKPS